MFGKISQLASPVGMTDYSVGREPYVLIGLSTTCPCKGRIVQSHTMNYAPLTGATLIMPTRDRAEALSCNMRPLQGQRSAFQRPVRSNAIVRAVKRHCPCGQTPLSVGQTPLSPARLSALPGRYIVPPGPYTKKGLPEIALQKSSVQKGQRPTLPHCIAVPSAPAGLTSLFGMGRGGTPRL